MISKCQDCKNLFFSFFDFQNTATIIAVDNKLKRLFLKANDDPENNYNEIEMPSFILKNKEIPDFYFLGKMIFLRLSNWLARFSISITTVQEDSQ